MAGRPPRTKGSGSPAGETSKVTKAAKGQQTLDDRVKKVTFIENEKEKVRIGRAEREREIEFNEYKELLTEEIRKIRKEKVEIEKVRIEVSAIAKEIEERMTVVENKMKELDEKWKTWVEGQSVRSEGSVSSKGRGPGEGAWGSQWSLWSGASGRSGVSLSEREVARVKRFVNEEDRKDRKDNIVIRGIKPDREDLKKWVGDFVGIKLGLKVNVDSAWKSWPVVVAKVSREDKEEIMRKKSKLRGTSVYIENDLSLEDRWRQEEINKWVKGKKAEGWMVKQGQGKVCFKGTWIRWENREDIEREMKNERGRREKENGEQNEKKVREEVLE